MTVQQLETDNHVQLPPPGPTIAQMLLVPFMVHTIGELTVKGAQHGR